MLKLRRDDTFFELLGSQADLTVRAAETFARMVDDLNRADVFARELQAIENDGDEITHKMQNKLSGAFITPLDQEDLSELSHLLDDVTDCIEAVAARIQMYRLTVCRPDLVPFAANLVDATHAIAEAVKNLYHEFHRTSAMPGVLVRIHTLENESDRLYRDALTRLFDEVTDAIVLLKWKEVYDRLEATTDRCEQIASVIENMILKYA